MKPSARTTPLAEIEPQRVCIIKPSALGDIVQTLPVLSMLRRRWPQAHLAWIANRSLAGLLHGHPDLDDVIEFDRAARGRRRLAGYWRLFRRLRREQFDLAIDFQGLLRSGLMARASGAPRRVGFSNAREGAVLAYTDRVRLDTRHIAALEKYCLIAHSLGCQGPPPAARLGLTAAERQWAENALSGLPRPILAIHPGAQWETKRWPPQHFAELAGRASREYQAGVVLVGGPGEEPLCAAIAARLEGQAVNLAGRTVNLAGRTGLLQLAAVCAAADVFLSGDTGPMHLAAAVGTPVVSVFTCTSPLRAGPRGSEHRIVATNVPCASSYVKTCPSLACMSELLPLRVWPVLSAALAQTAVGASRP